MARASAPKERHIPSRAPFCEAGPCALARPVRQGTSSEEPANKAAKLLLILILLYMRHREVFSRCEDVSRLKHKGPSSMDNRERRSHARGVYPTKDTSRMETARVKQEEESDTRIIGKYYERKNVGTIKEETFQLRPNLLRGSNYGAPRGTFKGWPNLHRLNLLTSAHISDQAGSGSKGRLAALTDGIKSEASIEHVGVSAPAY